MNDDLQRRDGHMPLEWFHRGTSPKAAMFPDDAGGEGGGEVTEAAVLAALGYTPAKLALGNYPTFTSDGLPGSYTLAKSGIVVKNAAGDEVFRIWGTDPSDSNFNAWNLYIGLKAGFSQPTDNVSAGYYNTGVGTEALYNITTGTQNSALGHYALQVVNTGSNNTGVGNFAVASLSTGDSNTGVGVYALNNVGTGNNNTGLGKSADVSAGNLTNATAIGANAVVDASNKIRLGDANVTLVETVAALTASAYKVGATAGIDFSGAVTNITVVKGIVTAAS